MNILEEAYHELFPAATKAWEFRVRYSGQFKDFGANIRVEGDVIELKLSRRFYGISKEIQMGCAQELLCKVFKRDKESMYIDLYNNFVKSLHLAIPKTETHPILEESFNRVNDRYFAGLVEQPNLVWGQASKRTLGTYDFKTDTITMSRIFTDAEDRYLDFVMFHEMLHKQRKFDVSGRTTRYHDASFRKAEKVFENHHEMEKDLNRFVSRSRLKSMFR